MPSMVKTFFTKGNAIMSSDEFLYWIHEKYFDDNGATRAIPKEVYLSNIHRALGSLMREPDLSNITDKTRKGAEERTRDLVSLSSKTNENNAWTAAAKPSTTGSNHIEAELWSLILNFVGDIVGNALMGQAFMENYPQLLDDLSIFDAAFGKLLSGMPGVTSTIRNAKAARRRLKSKIGEWTEAIMATQNGKEPEFKWSELSDVSETMKTRTRKFQESGASADAYVAGNLAILWGLMVNSNKVIFWMLLHIVASKDLQSKVRAEIAPFIEGWDPHHPPRALAIDVEGLTKSCPLLKASFFETMRLYTAGTSYKNVLKPLDLSESPEDAAHFGKDSPKTYHVAQGTFLAISHATMQTDPRLWDSPDTFNPTRFLVADEKEPSGVKADMLHLTPFGGGESSCKGRLFAEREVLVFVSAIMSVWDIEPLSEEGWRIPGKFYTGTGSANPTVDMRVRFQRRRS